MDLRCVTCGEPWDVDTVLHDEPEEFTKQGIVITGCPCCKENNYGAELSANERAKLNVAREMGELAGDDVDGYACDLEFLDATWEDE